MGKAIEQLASGLKVGHVELGLHGNKPGSVAQQVHDGDTITVRAPGNLGVRFLGVDAAEISFTLPGGNRFVSLSNPQWETFLSDPFAPSLKPFDPPLLPGLREYLAARVGPGMATNHAMHAQVAEDALEAEVRRDMGVLNQTEEDFQFFMVFAHEVMDGYGRLLGFINRDQPRANDPEPRPRSYNERLLAQGMVMPYFIWPNIDTFFRGSIIDAVLAPGTANTHANRSRDLRKAREDVQQARAAQLGIFDAQNPLRLYPFELRFLARRRPPDRWVIDLSKNDDQLIHPQNYYTIPNIEDRLFIPEEYVPLFVERGWRRQVITTDGVTEPVPPSVRAVGGA